MLRPVRSSGESRLHTFDLVDGKLSRTSEPEPNVRTMKREELGALRAQLVKDKSFRSGLCLDETRQCIYSLKINAGKLAVLPFGADAEEAKEVELGGRPYDVQLSPRNGLIYVSDWSERRITVVDPVSLRVVARIPVSEHPNQLAFHPADDRLFVANADNNCIAVIEVKHPNRSTVKGFIPTGWYPTAVAVTPDGKNLLVGVGKGNQSKANPIPKVEVPDSQLTETEQAVKKIQKFPYIGTNMSGALSIVPIPEDAALKEYTQQVYRNCPYSDDLLTAVPNKVPTAIPTRVGDTSPIKYVIYVIKENRTYDQVFGN